MSLATFITKHWTETTISGLEPGARVRIDHDTTWTNDDDGTPVFVKRGKRSGTYIGARRSRYNGAEWAVCRWTYKGHTFTSGNVHPECVAVR